MNDNNDTSAKDELKPTVKKEISPEGEVTLEIELSVEAVGGKFTDALKQFRKEVRLPGFRPGRVPISYIRKRYGKEIFRETAEELTKKYLPRVLEAEKLNPGRKIDIDMVEYGEDKPFLLKATFPLEPEVNLSVYKELRIMINDSKVTDNDVEEQIEALRRKHAILRAIDTPAPADAQLKLKVQEVDPSGLPLIGRKEEEMEFEFGEDILGIGSDEQLLGIRAGEKRIIHVRQVPGALAQYTQATRIISPGQDVGENASQTGEFSYSVEAVQVDVPELPEVDDEFATQIKSSLKTADDLRKYVEFTLKNWVATGRHYWIRKAIETRLIEENPFEIPKSIVEGTLETIADEFNLEGEKRADFLKEHYKEAERDYRWVRLRNAVAQEEKITVPSFEIDEEVQNLIVGSGESLEAAMRKYNTVEIKDRIRKNLLEEKVLDFLVTNAIVEKREMELDEFLRVTPL